MRATPVLVFAATFLIAGCLDQVTERVEDTIEAPTSLLAGPSLWRDPQNAPHPAFGFATLSAPPAGANLPAYWEPIPEAELPKVIKGISHLARSPEPVRSGAGIAIFGSLAVVPGYGNPSAILDISDPANPTLLSTFESQLSSHRGVTLIPYPDGRLVTVISTGSGLDIWDLTDPTKPEPLVPIDIGSHKVGVVPGTPIIYNAASGGGGLTGYTPELATGVTEIFDLTDPENPVRLPDFANGYSCHHVYFWNDLEKEEYRAICAGSEYAQIWDTADPRNPKVLVSVPIFHGESGTPSTSVPGAPWAHYAGLSIDGNILLVGDESGGGSAPPGCVAGADSPQGWTGTPVGALWFYDVSDYEDTKALGYFSPLNDPRVKAAPDTSCTAHHGRLVPAEGRDMVAMSFYGAGVLVIDFTDIELGRLPTLVDQYAEGSDTWETWYYNGYLFTGDLARGLDVIEFEGD